MCVCVCVCCPAGAAGKEAVPSAAAKNSLLSPPPSLGKKGRSRVNPASLSRTVLVSANCDYYLGPMPWPASPRLEWSIGQFAIASKVKLFAQQAGVAAGLYVPLHKRRPRRRMAEDEDIITNAGRRLPTQRGAPKLTPRSRIVIQPRKMEQDDTVGLAPHRGRKDVNYKRKAQNPMVASTCRASRRILGRLRRRRASSRMFSMTE